MSTLSVLLEHERQDDTMFATLCMTSVHPDRTTGWIRMAGHLPPLLVSRYGVAEFPTRPAAPLGLSEVRDCGRASRSGSTAAGRFCSTPTGLSRAG